MHYKRRNKNGIDIDVLAVGTQEFEDEVKNGWDIAMVAPQVRHRFDYLKGFADEVGTMCINKSTSL